ncbi:MAG TPA: hypothetical protein VJ623_03915 [Holophagaceae bacterium]|nr:hypothetical protein [Holophagaceae bacterium]
MGTNPRIAPCPARCSRCRPSGDRGWGPVLTEQGYRYLIESRHFESNGALSEPKVWQQLLAETGGV